ncbi:exodeoxyribonuclease V subunit alpha [Cellulomonas hominis]|uniref:RecBCD enzyme subunit RecD n=1 Tax=Cellulomonas hominis TaxID=156981 RepID=A0A7Z8NQI2_9CELL|nr:exodeoxyribonuclease V subunit alpha [Cellulomonas hominis]TKR27001.1 exodeoxyribonuclease V subunit alpha [Cellulomonas hominis]
MTAPRPADPRVPQRTGDRLDPFIDAGVLESGDVHVARRLSAAAGETSEDVLLAVALTVRAARTGSVCINLDDAADTHADRDPADGDDRAGLPPLPWPDPASWHAAVRRSVLIADGPSGNSNRPVRWVDGRVYLDRYWRDELLIRERVHARTTAPAEVDTTVLEAAAARLLPEAHEEQQRLAVRTAGARRLTVITGGPGTGKTTTVTRLLAALHDTLGPDLQVALAAPTGKAAARLHESISQEAQRLPPGDRTPLTDLTASTLHRLLGARPGRPFRHDGTHPLPHDVVIVDEASMVSLPLMARLFDAVRPDARLILVGDPDQLASVEAGAVLADLVASLPGGLVRLEHNYRFGTELGQLADAVRTGDGEHALALLRAGGPTVRFTELPGQWAGPADLHDVADDVRHAGQLMMAAATAGDATAALQALNEHRLLLAHREGRAGIARFGDLAREWIGAGSASPGERWPVGLPLIVNANDPATRLSNGDTGVVVSAPQSSMNATAAAFGDPTQPRLVRLHRLPAVSPVHAMTIHRSQGSQFSKVTVVLPPATSPLLTRELLYTAITRARDGLHVLAAPESVLMACRRPVRRASGLRHPLGAQVHDMLHSPS